MASKIVIGPYYDIAFNWPIAADMDVDMFIDEVAMFTKEDPKSIYIACDYDGVYNHVYVYLNNNKRYKHHLVIDFDDKLSFVLEQK